MPKISFVLKEPNADKDTAIILMYTCADGRLKYYTGENVNPADWNADKYNKGTRSELTRIRQLVETLSTDFKVKGDHLSKSTLKTKLEILQNRQRQDPVVDLCDEMEVIIEKMKSGKILTPKKKRYTRGSIKTFKFTVGLLRSFKPSIRPGDVTMQVYHEFISWCHKKGYSTNYIGGQIKNWKSLGKLVGGNSIYDAGDFKKIMEETDDIYLDEKEIKAIYDLKLVGQFDIVRDWFILDCFTGLRVSDLTILAKKNYRDGFITIANDKTDEKVIIPAHPYVKKILDKYKGFPPKVTDIQINKNIKLVAQKAKIDGNILYTITKGGERHDEYLQKWQMVSCHTARRSFITNLRKSGVPDSIVMKLTGIKSPMTLRRYDKLSSGEAAKIAASHKFFK